MAAVALIAAAVLVGSTFAVPWLVERGFARFEARAPGRTAGVESVRFDPLRLRAQLGSLRLSDSRAGYALGARSVTADLSLRGLLGRRLGFRSVVLESPDLELESLQSLTNVGAGLREARVPAVVIGKLEVLDGRLAAPGPTPEVPLRLDDIEARLSEFDGRVEAAPSAPGRLALQARTAGGATVEVEGLVPAGLRRATGRMSLTGVDLESVRLGLGGALRPVELDGRLDLEADYTLTAPFDSPTFEVQNGRARIDAFVLEPAAGITARAGELRATVNLALAPGAGDLPASGRIEIDAAQLALTDVRVTPAQTFELVDAAAVLSAEPGRDSLSINLGGSLAGGGEALLTARVPGSETDERSLSLAGTGLPARRLSSYAAQMLGRELGAGTADVDLNYTQQGRRVAGDLHLVARELALAPGDDPSLDLAAALLADASDVIDLRLPFAGNAGSVREAAALALRARVATLTATPLDAVAPLVDGGVGGLGAVPFVPGDAALGDLALATIDQLSALLLARPRLGLRVHGGYDAVADRNALARQQIQLHVLLATAGPSAQARPRPVDFGSERAQDVLDEFAGERLPADRVESIAARFACEDAVAALCRRAYYAALFDALVANEEITDAALNRLGRFRAQSVVEALTQRGVDPARLEVAPGARTIATAFGIGLPVDLSVAEL